MGILGAGGKRDAILFQKVCCSRAVPVQLLDRRRRHVCWREGAADRDRPSRALRPSRRGLSWAWLKMERSMPLGRYASADRHGRRACPCASGVLKNLVSYLRPLLQQRHGRCGHGRHQDFMARSLHDKALAMALRHVSGRTTYTDLARVCDRTGFRDFPVSPSSINGPVRAQLLRCTGAFRAFQSAKISQ